MLPLLLGVVGLLWQSMRSERGIEQFWVVFFLFFMTGIAIVLYLNQTPEQPRERDYAFAGSFYAYAIWIGLGVGAIAAGIDKLMKKPSASVPAAIIASVIGLIVPLQMVSQTWDDHDRSGRYTARDFGMNYLTSLDENAIIFTNGDNDTFPLWYAQEVEGYRTDVRVVNLSYLTTDWYANQLRHPSYEALPVPMTATSQQLGNDRRQSGFVIETDTIEPALTFLRRYYSPQANFPGVDYPVVSGGSIYIPVDIDAAVASGRITPDEAIEAVDAIEIDLIDALNRKNHQTMITQSDALSLDIIATDVANGWQRPVYFANTVPDYYYMGLRPYMYTTGMAREVLPLINNGDGNKEAKTDKAYRNITERYRWGGLDAENGDDVYLDETIRRMVISTRNGIIEVAATLIAEEKYDKALELLTLMDSKIPTSVHPYGVQMGDEVALYLITLGEELNDDAARQRGIDILESEINTTAPYLAYIASLTPRQAATLQVSDRAMMKYGDYSYLNDLMQRYLYAVGEDKAVEFFNSVSEKCGIDIVNFFMQINSTK